MTYDEALTILMTGRAHELWSERDEARQVVTDAVWSLATEEGDGKGEMYDWIAEGDFSPADLARKGAYSADALAAEWDALQRAARNL